MPGAKIMLKNSSTIISDPIRNFSKILNTFFSTAASLSDKIKILRLKNHLSNYSIELDDSEDMQYIYFFRLFGCSVIFFDNFFYPIFCCK